MERREVELILGAGRMELPILIKGGDEGGGNN